MTKVMSIGLMISGVLCFVAYNMIGATVDANGYVHEPFFLIPSGCLLLAIGAVIGIILLAQISRSQRHR